MQVARSRRGRSSLSHLFHAGHVAKHGGIFTLGGFILGCLIAAPWNREEHEAGGLLGATYYTYSNVFGQTGEGLEDFFWPMLITGGLLAILGLFLGKVVVRRGWMTHEEVHPE